MEQLQCDKGYWNFYESGPSKKAADGAGAALKRTCDNLVVIWIDIPKFKIQVTNFKAKSTGIILENMVEKDIQRVGLLLLKTIKLFRVSKKIQQNKWTKMTLESRVLKSGFCVNNSSHIIIKMNVGCSWLSESFI